MEEIQDHVTFPRSGQPAKITQKQNTVCEAAKVPRVTSKQLKAFLTLANINEPPSGEHWATMMGMEQEKSHCLKKKKSAC